MFWPSFSVVSLVGRPWQSSDSIGFVMKELGVRQYKTRLSGVVLGDCTVDRVLGSRGR